MKPQVEIIRQLFPRASATNQIAFDVSAFSLDSIEQLLFAEEILDAMDADLVQKTQYAALYAKAESFVKAHPELLQKPWLRAAGAVYDLIEALRQEQGACVPAYAVNLH